MLPFYSAFYSFLSRICPCVRSFRFHPASFPPLSFRDPPVRLGSSLLSFCFFLSPLQRSASQWLPACPPLSALPLSFASRFGFPPSLCSPPSPFGSFGSLRSGLGTRFRCSSFHRSCARLTAAVRTRLPSLSGSGLPLSFVASALGFGLLSIMIHPEN